MNNSPCDVYLLLIALHSFNTSPVMPKQPEVQIYICHLLEFEKAV